MKANGSGIKIHKYSSLYSHISIIMSFHIHFVRFISDARCSLLLLKPPAAGKFVNINIYTADRHWLGRWQPQQCETSPPPPPPPPRPCDTSRPVTDRTWLTAAISVAVSLVVPTRKCMCVCVCACQRLILYLISRFSFLFFCCYCCCCCPPLSLAGLSS